MVRSAARTCCFAIALGVFVGAARSTSAGDAPEFWFRVSVRPVEGAAEDRPSAAPAARSSGFRHTFGAERTTTEVRSGAAPDADGAIDVLLVHGVTEAAVLRRQLPAQTWTVVVSRHLSGGSGARPASVTGIGVRHAATLRIVRQEHFAPGSEGRATAALLRAGPTKIWLLSVDVAAAAHADVARWIEAQRAEGMPVLVAGRGVERLGLTATIDRAGATRATRPPPTLEARIDLEPGGKSRAVDYSARGAGSCGAQSPGVLMVGGETSLQFGRAWAGPAGGGGCLLVLDIAARAPGR